MNSVRKEFVMRKVLLFAIGIMMVTVSGCAMQADMLDMENEVKIMKGMLLEMQRDVTQLQKANPVQQQERSGEQTKEDMERSARYERSEGKTKEAIEALQKNQANFEIRFDQLSTDVQVIQGSLEENSHKVMELSENADNQDAAVEELTRKVDQIESTLKEISAASVKLSSDNEQSPQPAAVQPPTPPSELYNQAFKDYVAGNYEIAITGFTNYLSQAQDGNLAPNAMYWIGESYYSKGEYENAVKQFKKVTDEYPKSDKVAGSFLKIGYVYEKMGDKDMAIVYFKKVVEQFPNAHEASLAKVKLSEIK
ncbi:MAG: tol-pal system protein YbgF [Nitrospirae bacterium]|nr:tol-pal system protein YbgF [Nitrospirota bacterium]